MNSVPPHTRRGFVREAAGAAALASLAALKTARAEPPPATTRPRTKIRIGTRISPAWLESADDNDLRFLKQIGLDVVDITLDKVEGYADTGRFTKDALQKLGLSSSQQELDRGATGLIEELELRNSRPLDPDLLALFLDGKVRRVPGW